VEDDLDFARILLSMVRENQFKGLVALNGEDGLELAKTFKPQAITLDLLLPGMNGWTFMEKLREDEATKDIPVHVISVLEGDPSKQALGAIAYLKKPVSKEALDSAFSYIAGFLDKEMRNLLLVEDDDIQRDHLAELLGQGGITQVRAVRSAEEALAALKERHFDCMILDLVLPGQSGIEFIQQLRGAESDLHLPIVVYTSKDLSEEEKDCLAQFAEAVIPKTPETAQQLLQETSRFLKRVENSLPARPLPLPDQLSGKKVLVVDDDARNIFALASVLESCGVEVLYSENGLDGINTLKEHPEVDLVLMDIMMPGMDGYETMEAIRRMPVFEHLPVIALTAKAMPGDREKCLEAGASDYIAKPVDTEKLLTLMREWLGPSRPLES
jgi:CheY-like chemotaxis protein